MIGFGGALVLAMGVGTFIAFALAALAPLLRRELRLSRSEVGALPSAFFLVGALCSPVAGRLVDRFGGRIMQIWLFYIAALALAGFAVAPNYPVLFAAAIVAGVPLSLANPATNKLVAEIGAAGGQGVLVAFKQSGVQMAALLAGALLPSGAMLMGRRGVLLASLTFPIIGVLATKRFVPARQPVRRKHHRFKPRTRSVGWLTAYAFLMGVGVSTMTAYLPLYAHERLGFNPSKAGLVAAIVAIVSLAARLAWGRIGDSNASASTLLAVMAVGGILSQALILSAPSIGEWMIWTGATMLGATASAWNVVGMLAIVKNFDIEAAGQASGVVLFAFYGGSAAGPIAFGYTVDATGGYTLGWIIAVAGCFAAAVTATARTLRTRRHHAGQACRAL